VVDQVPRNPAGKAQYPRAKDLALADGQVRQTV
jgi:hypothetical protein